MSSLSQEDLDAGWDDEPEQLAMPKAEAADAVSQSIPPNSITIEKSPAPLDSAVVRSAPDNAELAGSTGTDPLSPPDVTLTESTGAPPVVEALAQVAPTSLEPAVEPPAELSPAQSTAPTESQLGEQPTAASPESMARATASNLEQTIPPVSGTLVSSSSASAVDPPDSQAELFTAVTAKPQLLVYQGVDTPEEVDPVAPESATEALQVSIDPQLVESPAVLRESDVPASQGTHPSHEFAVDPEEVAPPEALALAQDETVAVQVARRTYADSYVIRHWRAMAIAAAAALFLVVGLLAIRSKRPKTTGDQPVAAKIVGVQTGHVAPVFVANAAGEVAPVAKLPAPVEIGAPAPVRAVPATGAPVESFSDAFVKHAATANSSWADVKKRPKSIEPSQLNKASATSNAKADDNPLDVLDKLEKARKAKKSAEK